MRRSKVQVRSWAGERTRRGRIAPTESLLDTELARLREKQARMFSVLPWEVESAADDDEAPPPDEKLSKVAVFGAVATSIILLFGNWYVLDQIEPESLAGTQREADVPENSEPAYPLATIESAREVARLFLEAKTDDDRLKWTRDLPGLRERMKQYPEETTALPVAYERLDPMGTVEAAGGFEFRQFAVRMSGGGMRLVCVVWTDQGLRVDWDAFARHSTADWDALVTGSVDEAELRVFVRPVEYYVDEFADDARWQSFELVSPDWPRSLYGYAVKGTPTAAMLGEMVSTAPHWGRVTVRVKAGREPGRRQVEIARLAGTCWVKGEYDPEESYTLRQMMAAE